MYAVSPGFGQNTITDANAPTFSLAAPVATFVVSGTSPRTYSVDISSYIAQLDQNSVTTAAFAIAGINYTNGSVQFNSSLASNGPELVLTSASPVVLNSAYRSVGANGEVDGADLGYGRTTYYSKTVTNTGFGAFNGNASIAATTGRFIIAGSTSGDDVMISGQGTMQSTLSANQITASGTASGFEYDTNEGLDSGGVGSTNFLVTFTVISQVGYQILGSANSDYGEGAYSSFVFTNSSGTNVVNPPNSSLNFNVSQSGVLAPGVYTISLQTIASSPKRRKRR